MSVEISIIIANYNTGNYIERSVKSALAQEDVSLEVIVIDDKSTDNSLAILAGISDPRLKIISFPKNQGVSAARNAGIALSQGRWISILDADDAFESDRSRRMLDLAIKNDADVIVDNLSVTREIDGKKFVMFPPKKFAQLKELSLVVFMREKLGIRKGYPLGYLKPMILKEFMTQHELRYNETIRIGEDYVLMAELLGSGAKCSVDPTAGYLYTARLGSTSYRLTSKDVEIELRAQYEFHKKYKLSGDDYRAHKRRVFFIKERLAYTKIVEALKSRKWLGALKIALLFPSSVRHLWEPVLVRIIKYL